jgi:hypothetical protein
MAKFLKTKKIFLIIVFSGTFGLANDSWASLPAQQPAFIGHMEDRLLAAV